MSEETGKHTPGPWVATPMVKHANNAFYITATPDGNNSEKEVAVVGPCLAATTEANARLIASAPELLEAIEDCIGLLEVLVRAGPSTILDAARAVSAKARGRS